MNIDTMETELINLMGSHADMTDRLTVLESNVQYATAEVGRLRSVFDTTWSVTSSVEQNSNDILRLMGIIAELEKQIYELQIRCGVVRLEEETYG